MTSKEILNLTRYSSSSMQQSSDQSKISGFYYDHQLSNRLLNVTLHANKFYDNGVWKRWGEVFNRDIDSGGYGLRPLCTAVMTEDFALSIQNNWSNAESNNDLEGTFNNFKQFAPYLTKLGDTLSEMSNTSESKKSAEGSTLAQGLNKIAGVAGKYTSKTGDLLTRSLVVNATRHAYYQGSVSSFNNLSLKFTLFPDYFKTGGSSDQSNSAFISIHDQLNILYPYMIGKFSKFTTEVNKVYGKGTIESGEISKELNRWLGWQCPPGGLKSNLQNYDTIQDGTLKLQFGPYYSIDNLVIRDVQLSFSKQMVKVANNSGNNTNTTIMPLYCDVLMSFQPVIRYTDKNLEDLFSGEKTKDSIETASNSLANSLKQAEVRMKQDLGLG